MKSRLNKDRVAKSTNWRGLNWRGQSPVNSTSWREAPSTLASLNGEMPSDDLNETPATMALMREYTRKLPISKGVASIDGQFLKIRCNADPSRAKALLEQSKRQLRGFYKQSKRQFPMDIPNCPSPIPDGVVLPPNPWIVPESAGGTKATASERVDTRGRVGYLNAFQQGLTLERLGDVGVIDNQRFIVCYFHGEANPIALRWEDVEARNPDLLSILEWRGGSSHLQ